MEINRINPEKLRDIAGKTDYISLLRGALGVCIALISWCLHCASTAFWHYADDL